MAIQTTMGAMEVDTMEATMEVIMEGDTGVEEWVWPVV